MTESTLIFPVDLTRMLESIERQYITLALEKTEGNRYQAAKLLGLKRTTLLMKMKRIGMPLNEPTAAKRPS